MFGCSFAYIYTHIVYGVGIKLCLCILDHGEGTLSCRNGKTMSFTCENKTPKMFKLLSRFLSSRELKRRQKERNDIKLCVLWYVQLLLRIQRVVLVVQNFVVELDLSSGISGGCE